MLRHSERTNPDRLGFSSSLCRRAKSLPLGMPISICFFTLGFDISRQGGTWLHPLPLLFPAFDFKNKTTTRNVRKICADKL